MEAAWTFEHSVLCAASVEFAWKFWTDVSHWVLDSDVASVTLDGPFAAGARGVTESKSAGRIEWRVAEAREGRAVIEFPAPGAVGRFVWTFEDAQGGSRITQVASLAGEQAMHYVESFGRALEQGIPPGMEKLRAAIEAAA